MSFDLADHYVWDFWTVLDPAAGRHHLFFLKAPRSLGDPDLRHRSARVGHASSVDLRDWTLHPDPLPYAVDGFDDLASWTGCAVLEGGRCWLLTTGLSRGDDGSVQRIGSAVSEDLESWSRTPLLLEADPERHQKAQPSWPEEAWRDPWVVRGADGRWHMYVTARDVSGEPGCGVIGHATSPDLLEWHHEPPLSVPTGRFEWMEVIQVVEVEGRWVLLFSCLADQMPGAAVGEGGVWSVAIEGPGSEVDVAAAVRLTDESTYVGKVVVHDGAAHLMAFRNQGPDGGFVGGLTDPVPLRWRSDGRGLELDGTAAC